MNRKMDPKKFLLYYIPVAVIVLIFGRFNPQWVEDNIVIYYVILLGWAGVADMLATRPVKEDEKANAKQQPVKNNKNNNNKYYSKNNKKKHK